MKSIVFELPPSTMFEKHNTHRSNFNAFERKKKEKRKKEKISRCLSIARVYARNLGRVLVRLF
jgi:hypothetical protein